jgi:hypothetical protein
MGGAPRVNGENRSDFIPGRLKDRGCATVCGGHTCLHPPQLFSTRPLRNAAILSAMDPQIDLTARSDGFGGWHGFGIGMDSALDKGSKGAL